MVARLLAQYWIDRGRPFAGIDADLSHGALLRHYGDFSQAVDLTSPDSADQILDRALGGERRVLVDLPAQSARALKEWIFGANVLGLAHELGATVTFWHVTDGGYASVGEVERALELYGDQAHHIVVKNHARSKNFSQWEASAGRRKLDALSGKVMDFPELESTAMFKIDSAGLSFWAGAHMSDGEGALKPLERQRVKLWLNSCYAQLDALLDAV